ncbi:MAG: hypothetical protein RLZZ142_1799 [Verrucomicrobiota bacterium]|jgi:hypothetical protein
MSAVCVIAPIVVSAWPGFTATVVAAAASLGYRVVDSGTEVGTGSRSAQREVELEMANCDIVTDALGRDQRFAVSKDGVRVTFSRDARGRAGVCVTGEGMSEEALRAAGLELTRRVVQKHVHQRILEEVQARGYTVAEDYDHENQSIRLRIRHWEN